MSAGNFVCVNNQTILNLDAFSIFDLQQPEGRVRAWLIEGASEGGDGYRDFQGDQAEAIRAYARTGMLNLYPDRTESVGAATIRNARAVGASGQAAT